MNAEKHDVAPTGKWRCSSGDAPVCRPKLIQPADLFSGVSLGLEAIFRFVARTLGRQAEAVADTLAEKRIQERLHGARRLVQKEMSRPSSHAQAGSTPADHPRKSPRLLSLSRRTNARTP